MCTQHWRHQMQQHTAAGGLRVLMLKGRHALKPHQVAWEWDLVIVDFNQLSAWDSRQSPLLQARTQLERHVDDQIEPGRGFQRQRPLLQACPLLRLRRRGCQRLTPAAHTQHQPGQVRSQSWRQLERRGPAGLLHALPQAREGRGGRAWPSLADVAAPCCCAAWARTPQAPVGCGRSVSSCAVAAQAAACALSRLLLHHSMRLQAHGPEVLVWMAAAPRTACDPERGHACRCTGCGCCWTRATCWAPAWG